MHSIAVDPVVTMLRNAIGDLYGPALDRIVLFGSRARGDAQEDSDYDVAVFLKHAGNLWTEWGRLAVLRANILSAGGPFIDAIPFLTSDFDQRTPLMHEIRKDGLTL